jgi:methylated-DNA-[protein]-cysteine S-methyltransferase
MTPDKLHEKLAYKLVASPIGMLKLVASTKGLVAILWENDKPRRVRLAGEVEEALHPVLVRTEIELSEYFAGKRDKFSVPLDMRGTTFQKQVWQALLAIPFGETRTYSNLANRLENPAATRAVGAANGRNPIAIVVPCHRVIGATGSLTGFAGGLQAKAHLRNLEGANIRKLSVVVDKPDAGNPQLSFMLGTTHSPSSQQSAIPSK